MRGDRQIIQFGDYRLQSNAGLKLVIIGGNLNPLSEYAAGK